MDEQQSPQYDRLRPAPSERFAGQSLEGEFVLRVDDADHEMRAGQLLVLKPNIVHDVRALERGAILLTVVMEKG